MSNIFKNYINGEWIASRSGEVIESINPANKYEVVGSVQKSTKEELDAAVKAAKQAQTGWRKLSGADRGNYIYKVAAILENRLAEIATTMTKEMGKSVPEAEGETKRGIQIIKYYESDVKR